MSDRRKKNLGGRPLTGEQKLSVDIKVRIDDTTNQRLQTYCTETGTARAAAVRQGVLELLDRYDKTKGSGTDAGAKSGLDNLLDF